MGKIVPNSYQKPNLYTDRLMRFLTGDEWKTLDYALRRTFGWNKTQDRISVSQFRNGNGRLDEDGQPLEYGTGLSQVAQVEAIHELMRFGILMEVAANNARKEGRLWALQLDESGVRFDLIKERYAAQQDNHRRKTAKARQAAVESRVRPTGAEARSPSAVEGVVPVDNFIGLTDRPMPPVCGTDRYQSVGQTDMGLTDRPIPVCGTDTQKDSRNTKETQLERQLEGEGVRASWHALVNFCDGDEERAGAVWRLSDKFAAVTQLRQPSPATADGCAALVRDWWPNLKLVLEQADGDPEAAEAALTEAVQSMDSRRPRLNVSSPRSVVNVATSVLAGRRRGATVTPAARPRGMAGIEAYATRRGIND